MANAARRDVIEVVVAGALLLLWWALLLRAGHALGW